MSNEHADMNVTERRVPLERHEFTEHHALPDVDVRRGEDLILGVKMVEFRAWLHAQVVESETVVLQTHVEKPSSWWDHLKIECFPAWALARWPVKMDVVEDRKMYVFKVIGTFPDWRMKIPFRDMGEPVFRTIVETTPTTRGVQDGVRWGVK